MHMDEFHLGGGTISLERFLAEAREDVEALPDGDVARIAIPCMIYLDVKKDNFELVSDLLITLDEEGTRVDFVEEAGPFTYAILYPGFEDAVVMLEDNYTPPDSLDPDYTEIFAAAELN